MPEPFIPIGGVMAGTSHTDPRWPDFRRWHARSAREASDYQIEMLVDYAGNKGSHTVEVFTDAWNSSNPDSHIKVADRNYTVPQLLQEAIVTLALHGQTLWVANDIREMLSQAASQVGSETLRVDDPPYVDGVVWLPVAHEYFTRASLSEWTDQSPNMQKLVSVTPPGAVIGRPMTNSEDTKHLIDAEFPDGVPLVAIGWTQNSRGVMVYCFTATSQMAFKSGSPRVLIVDLWQWDFDQEWDELPVPEEYEDADFREEWSKVHATPWVANTRRFLITLWRFMAQEIVVVEHDPDRATRRRAERAGKTSKFSTVKLRRVHHQHPDHVVGTVEWSCRWIQKGHWRTLHRGTDKQRKVWVSPGIKGPEGLPMKVSHNVISVER